MSAPVRIGLDFDNTIAIYDRVFHRHAQELGMPADVPATKHAVRAWFWSQPDGNTPWTELQGLVYGTKLLEAELGPGLEAFLRACQERGVAVSVISHKTQFPALGPKHDLRQAAREFLAARGIVGELGVDPARVFFNDTRAEKVARVASEGCAAFVDDLPGVFTEPGFPTAAQRLLLDRGGEVEDVPPGVVPCRDFQAVAAAIWGD
ncbi:MAG: hypothetical protein R3F62_16435 [Planctomycetota bacterium]